MSQTPYQRIKRILKFYENRGVNKENINIIYRQIIKQKYGN